MMETHNHPLAATSLVACPVIEEIVEGFVERYF
jgi:hypothetical protein